MGEGARSEINGSTRDKGFNRRVHGFLKRNGDKLKSPVGHEIHETPDPDLTGHRGDKNTQTDGRVPRQGGGGQQTQPKISEKSRTAIIVLANVCLLCGFQQSLELMPIQR